jgi:hypothetical protein
MLGLPLIYIYYDLVVEDCSICAEEQKMSGISSIRENVSIIGVADGSVSSCRHLQVKHFLLLVKSQVGTCIWVRYLDEVFFYKTRLL